MPAALPDFGSCRRVLIIKPSSLGDIVHTLPTVHLLKESYPHLEFTWVINPVFASLVEGNADLAGTAFFPRDQFRGLGGLWRFSRWLNHIPPRLKPDIALDFQGLLRSGLTAHASRAPLRAGFSDSREGARFFHTHIIPVNPDAHAIDRSLTLPRAFGLAGPACFPLPQGSCPAAFFSGNAAYSGTPPAPRVTGAETLSLPPAPILLHPFSRGKRKSLTPPQTLLLCQALSPLPVILVGRSELTFSDPLPTNTRNLLNQTTLHELIWLIRRARGVISVDSGPMHIAAALTPHVLSLHAWSDPRKVGPWHAGTSVYKAGKLMQTGHLDPAFCSLSSDIPDSAIPQIAAWAFQTPSAPETREVLPGSRPFGDS